MNLDKDFIKTDADHPSFYSLNVKRAWVAALFLCNLLVWFSPRVEVTDEETEVPQIVIDIENIPITHQARRTPPPPKPKLPIPSDDETIPEDETIEETTLKYTNLYDDTYGIPDISGISLIPPKPIAWVFPEYPEEEKKKGVEGVVRLSIHIDEKGKVVDVVVLQNTTNSLQCAKAAIDAAYGSRFFPAKEGKKTVAAWISQPYRFDIKE